MSILEIKLDWGKYLSRPNWEQLIQELTELKDKMI